ncbi:MAG: hypothetical protein HYV32_04725 [Candidatus Kerfeldbacteria bacterium]|nr:hypothetical protein [Candidatus Kerfeldbacteria bacterium]
MAISTQTQLAEWKNRFQHFRHSPSIAYYEQLLDLSLKIEQVRQQMRAASREKDEIIQ